MPKRLSVALSKISGRLKQSQSAFEQLNMLLDKKNSELLSALYQDKTSSDDIQTNLSWQQVREIVLTDYERYLKSINQTGEDNKIEQLAKICAALKKCEK